MDLGKYIHDNGIMVKWFAEQIGASNSKLSQFLYGNSLMPTIYWENIVRLTNSAVTIRDLMEMNNKYYEKNGRIPGQRWKNLPRVKRDNKKIILDNQDSVQLSQSEKTEHTE